MERREKREKGRGVEAIVRGKKREGARRLEHLLAGLEKREHGDDSHKQKKRGGERHNTSFIFSGFFSRYWKEEKKDGVWRR